MSDSDEDISGSDWGAGFARLGWRVWSTGDGVHVIPVGEPHRRSGMCWCRPTLERDGGGRLVWVHHSRDRREYTVERQ
jgi:hypothetical protein